MELARVSFDERLCEGLAIFRFLRLAVELESVSESVLPGFVGSTLRGALGHALKESLCARLPDVCANCRDPENCSYSYLFETNARNYLAPSDEQIPHPFILRAPWNGPRSFKRGDRLSLELLLVGEGCRYFPYFLQALAQAGSHGLGTGMKPFRLASVAALRPGCPPVEVFDIERSEVFHDPGPPVTGEEAFAPWETLTAERIVIRFLTPARLKRDGKLADAIPFEILVRRLLRRIGALSFYHHGAKLDLDFTGIVEMARTVDVERSRLRWEDWQRHSSRQDQLLTMGGLVGEIVYRGTLTPLLPLLAVGEWVHVGKATSLGLGRFRVVRVVAQTTET